MMKCEEKVCDIFPTAKRVYSAATRLLALHFANDPVCIAYSIYIYVYVCVFTRLFRVFLCICMYVCMCSCVVSVSLNIPLQGAPA